LEMKISLPVAGGCTTRGTPGNHPILKQPAPSDLGP
jgi:hypothetical protein